MNISDIDYYRSILEVLYDIETEGMTDEEVEFEYEMVVKK